MKKIIHMIAVFIMVTVFFAAACVCAEAASKGTGAATVCEHKLLEKLYAEMNEAEMLLFDCIINNDMTLKDVSILTEENVNTVKSRWLRLRKKLEKWHFKKK